MAGFGAHSSDRRHTLGALVLGAAALVTAIPTGAAFAIVPISIDAGADAVVLEGSPLVRTLAIVDEVDDGDPGWSYSIDYGDGLVTVGTTFAPTLTLDHAYPDGPATHIATVIVNDVPGDVAGDSFVVTVQNVAPVVTIPAHHRPPRVRRERTHS